MTFRKINKINDIYNDNFNYLKLFINTTYDAIDNYQNLWLNLINPDESSSESKREDQIEGIQINGDRFLSELYHLSKGDQSKAFDLFLLGENLGFNRLDTEKIVSNLTRAELIRQNRATNAVSLTPYGLMTKKGQITVGYAPVH